MQSLVHQSPDIQKILAFEGAFEKLFNIVQQEGGLEGGPVVHDALLCVDNLLRFNSSNQVRMALFFRDNQFDRLDRAISAKHLCHLSFRHYSCSPLRYHLMSLLLKDSRYSSGIHLRSVLTPVWSLE